jgi:ribosomal protein S27E
MKINCLSCGHKVDLGDAYEEYEGQVKCFACTAILEIKTE